MDGRFEKCKVLVRNVVIFVPCTHLSVRIKVTGRFNPPIESN